jgi:Flp pilus assembly protein TadG
LALPIFLTVAMGIAEFGQAMRINHALATAAREGARLAAVTPDLTADDPRVQARVEEVLNQFIALDGESNLQVEVTAPATGQRGDAIEVTVGLRFQFMTGSIFAQQGDGIPLETTVVMLYEGR